MHRRAGVDRPISGPITAWDTARSVSVGAYLRCSRYHQVYVRAGGRESVRRRPHGGLARSVASGQDADSIEAVDLDEFVGANEMEVLALRRLSALGAADAKYLNNASVSGDAIAGTNTTGKGDLRGSRRGHDDSLLVRRWLLQPLGWPV